MSKQQLTAEQKTARASDGRFGHTRSQADDITASDRAAALDSDTGGDPDPTEPWLKDFRCTSVSREVYQAAPDAPQQPGAMCDRCGMGIMNVVHAQHIRTGEKVKLGMDCAERAGLDKNEVAAMLRERHQSDRQEAWREEAAERRAAEIERDQRETEEHGEHGSLSRYEFGCTCEECRDAAPHATLDRLERGCYCDECIAAAVESKRYAIHDIEYLIDAETGIPIDNAKIISTRFGASWVINEPAKDESDDDGWGHSLSTPPIYVSPSPKRRNTMLKKGYLEASVPTLCYVTKKRDYPITRLEAPAVDAWDEPIEVKGDAGERKHRMNSWLR